MKNLLTLLITLFLTFSYAQQVTIGSQGTGVFFSSEENVYVTAIVLKFENAVTLVRGSAFESYWVPLLIDENDFSLSWNQNVGDGDNANRMLLNGNSVKAAFKPTSNEFKQFYNFSVANELIEIVEVTGYVSEDGSVPASSDLVKLTTNLDNTLNVNDVVFSQVQPYPNPFNDIISIPGLKESVVAALPWSFFIVIAFTVLQKTVTSDQVGRFMLTSVVLSIIQQIIPLYFILTLPKLKAFAIETCQSFFTNTLIGRELAFWSYVLCPGRCFTIELRGNLRQNHVLPI